MPKTPVILLSNDDGYFAPGLKALREAMAGLGRIVVCAPDTEQSAKSHSLTLHRPLRLRQFDDDAYAVDGTPTDAVVLGIHKLLHGKKPDLVVSGINSGPNLGDDIGYSGTVAAALEGTVYGIPSIAVSLTSHEPKDFSVAKTIAREVAEWAMANGLPSDTTLNVNVPDLPLDQIKGKRVTVQGKRHFEDLVTERHDPRGREYFWIAGKRVVPAQDPRSDLKAVEEHYISITPLRVELTAHDALDHLKSLEAQSFKK